MKTSYQQFNVKVMHAILWDVSWVNKDKSTQMMCNMKNFLRGSVRMHVPWHKQEVGLFNTDWILLQHVRAASIRPVSSSNKLKSFLLLLDLIFIMSGCEPTFWQRLHEDRPLCQQQMLCHGTDAYVRACVLRVTRQAPKEPNIFKV